MEENELLKKINNKNPQPGIPYKLEEYFEDGFIKVFSWMTTISKEFNVERKNLARILRKFVDPNFTVQMYFDIIVLGIIDVSDRPKCIVCGEPVKFEGKLGRLSYRPDYTGYFKTCSETCHRDRKIQICKIAVKSGANLNDTFWNKISSQEYRDNMSKVKKGTKFTESHKSKISKAIKEFRKTEEGIEHTKKLAEIRSVNNIDRLKSSDEYTDLNRKNGRYKSGNYDSVVWGETFRYDSSWELDFIKYTEKSCISGDISYISRCQDSIIYYRSESDKINKHHHRYLPDFYIEFKSGIKVVIELKPSNIVKKDPIVTRKRLSAKKFFKDKGIKYLILTEKDMYFSGKEGKGFRNNFNIYDYII